MELNAKLIHLSFGRCPRLIVTMPPRHGKSMLISQYFPAWYIGTFPDRRVMLASYEAGFASTWGRKARDVLEEHGPELFGIKVRDDSSAADRWDVLGRTGGMVTAGVGGPLTGKGADCLIIDDPCKNAEEASSKVIRDKVWEWFQSTAYTRLEPNGAIVLVMTRWHEDDLAGRIIKEAELGGERWDILNLQAINDQGEALWPERFPIERLEEIRRTVGTYYWQALYQQRPIAPGGEVLRREWFPITDIAPKNMRMCRYWDKAATEDDGDYTVGVKMGERDGECCILDVIRVRRGSADVERIIRQAAEADGYGCVVFMEEEGGSSGKDVTDHYQRHVLRGYSFQAIRPTGSKVVRAMPFSAAAERGAISLLGPADWIHPFLEECGTFPKGEHDDQVDAAAGAYNQLMRSSDGLRMDASEAVGGPRDIPTFRRGPPIMRDEDEQMRIPGL